jgi:ATP-dependent DNA helicase RecG
MPESSLSITLLEPTKTEAKPVVAAPKNAMQKLLEKLGLKRDIDLALHLPLRYEDERR